MNTSRPFRLGLLAAAVLFSTAALAQKYQYNLNVPGFKGPPPATATPGEDGGSGGPGESGGDTPSFSLSPASLSFGSLPVGQTSAVQQVTVMNTSNVAGAVSGVSMVSGASDFGVSNNCASPLPPGGTCTINVAFTAATGGARTGTIAVAHNGTGGFSSANVSGFGLQAVGLLGAVASNDFGTVLANTSATRVFSFQNTGDLVATGSYAQVSGSPFLSITDNTCGTQASAVEVPAGGSCSVTVRYAPTTAGSLSGAALRVFSSAVNSPAHVSILGSSTTTTGTLTPQTDANFGYVALNSSDTRVFVFTNTGAGVAGGARAEVTGTGLSITDSTCGTAASPVDIALGATCSVTVTYAPEAVGTLSSANVRVLSTAANSPSTVAITGSTKNIITNFGSYRAWSDGTVASSCNAYRTATGAFSYEGATGDGLYRIDVDGPGGTDAFSATCDMTSDGGGWTRVVVQYETTPLTSWDTAGINGGSHVLRSFQIPSHTQVGFGQNNQATAVDYVTMTYSTGNIALRTVTSPRTGKTYQVHRNAGQYYGRHDPEQGAPAIPSSRWYNTLTLDEVGTLGYNWAFAPLANDGERGYSFGGALVASTTESYAWTVWVR